MGFFSRLLEIFTGAAETVVSITAASIKAEAKRRAVEKVTASLPDMTDADRVAVENIINQMLDEVLAEVTQLNSSDPA